MAIFPSNRRDQGFTLLELLVATALVAFLAAGLAANMGTGARIWEISESRSLRQSESAVLETILRNHLSRAVPGAVTVNSRTRRGVFEGDRERIRFLTTAETGVTGGGIFGEELEIRRIGDAVELVVRRARTPIRLGGARGSTRWDESSIPLPGGTPRFAFFGALDARGAEAWHDRWDGANRQPALVGLFFSNRDGATDVRDIIIAPRRNQPALMIEERELGDYMNGAGN